MNKVNSLEALRQIQVDSARAINLRNVGENPNATVLTVGMGTCGLAAGAREVMLALIDAANANDLLNVSVTAVDCLGFCYAEPMVEVRKPNAEAVRYARVDANMAKDIVEKHVMQDQLLNGALTGKEVPKQ